MKKSKYVGSKHVSNMTNYDVPSTDDHYKLKKTGNASFKGWADYQQYQIEEGWQASGVSRGKLSSRLIYDHSMATNTQFPNTRIGWNSTTLRMNSMKMLVIVLHTLQHFKWKLRPK
jgi:hypothetical protein